MKISNFLKILIGIEVILLFYKYVPPELGNKVESMLLPGYESNHLYHLHPQLQKKAVVIVSSLEEKGFTPKIYTTYRSSEMQDFFYSFSNGGRVLGVSPMTRARGTQSCHTKKDKEGKPSSTAFDIWGKPYGAFLALQLDVNFSDHVRFFNALGVVVKEQNLEWGGRWTSQQSVWTKHGLGWDPAHIQMGRCN
jgi:hypothetical protein